MGQCEMLLEPNFVAVGPHSDRSWPIRTRDHRHDTNDKKITEEMPTIDGVSRAIEPTKTRSDGVDIIKLNISHSECVSGGGEGLIARWPNHPQNHHTAQLSPSCLFGPKCAVLVYRAAIGSGRASGVVAVS